MRIDRATSGQAVGRGLLGLSLPAGGKEVAKAVFINDWTPLARIERICGFHVDQGARCTP